MTLDTKMSYSIVSPDDEPSFERKPIGKEEPRSAARRKDNSRAVHFASASNFSRALSYLVRTRSQTFSKFDKAVSIASVAVQPSLACTRTFMYCSAGCGMEYPANSTSPPFINMYFNLCFFELRVRTDFF